MLKHLTHHTNRILYAVILFGLVITSIAIAWIALASCNFFYGVWHDHGGIGDGIERFAPENKYKQHFAHTSKQQREQLFWLTVKAIHLNGRGLDELRYSVELPSNVTVSKRTKADTSAQASAKNYSDYLYRTPEIIHLQDVAKLVNAMLLFALAVLLVTVIALVWLKRRLSASRKSLTRAPLSIGSKAHVALELPSIKRQWAYIAGAVTILFIVLMVFGPERVFNQLHIWIFPKDHQWFFYYQESLMSTMMLAPRLFAFIAALWLALSLCVIVILQNCLQKWINP